MNTKIQKLALSLALLWILLLSGCIGFGHPLDTEDQEKIDQQIRDSIEKTFPLPKQVVIKTHVGDDLRFSTDLSVEETVTFYRDAYAQNGYVENADSFVSENNATLFFTKEGKRDVSLEVTGKENGCDVHLFLNPLTP